MAKDAFGKAKATPGKVIESFGNTTSAHGIPKIIGATSYLSSFLWTVVTLVALGAFCYQGGTLVFTFFHWPFTTKLDIVTRPALQFPAVTVCNMNKLRRSHLVDTKYAGLIALDGGTRNDDYSWWFDWPDHFDDYYQYSDYLLYDPEPLMPDSMSAAPMDGNPTESSSQATQPLDGSSTPPPPPLDGNPTKISGSDTQPPDGFPSSPPLAGSTPPPQPQTHVSGAETESPSYADPSIPDPWPLPSFRKRRSLMSGIPVRGADQRGQLAKERVRTRRQAGPPLEPPPDPQPDPYEEIFNRFEGLDRKNDFEFYDFFGFVDVKGENDWAGFYEDILRTGDFSKWLDIVNPPREEVDRMGHQEREFIAQCSFDKKNCSAEDFHKFQNSLYGNCYVFNHAVNMTTPRDTGKTGAQHGLHLTLFVEQPEYIGLLTQETGVRVAIHDPHSIPYPEDDGFTVPTGVSSSIGIRQSFIQRLSEPHGNCTSGANSNFSSTEFQYSRRACLKHCFQNHLQEKCGCVTDIGMEEPLCSVVNSTQQICKQYADTLFQDDLLGCVCPTPCSEYGYRKTVSSSTWPSERFEPHLVRVLKDKNEHMERILRDVTLTRKNLVQLKIYFEELNYESIEQTPLYTYEGLLGGVGGLMGLYIGLSVISVAEIVVFVCRFLRASWDKMTRREAVKPLPPGSEELEVQDFDYGYKGTGVL